MRNDEVLEFMMTYGWAILVVVVAVGALAYFEVLEVLDSSLRFNPNTDVCEEFQSIKTCEHGYNAGRLSIKCEEFCESKGLSCISFEGAGCPKNKKDKDLFVCLDQKKYYLESENNLKCTKFRKKSPEELEADYCNNNPDDEKNCICDEKNYGGYSLNYSLDSGCYEKEYLCRIGCWKETQSAIGECHDNCAINSGCLVERFFECISAHPIG